MTKYKINLKFETDRELTEHERECLMNAVCAQIEDPHVDEGGETVRATFRVRQLEFADENESDLSFWNFVDSEVGGA